LLARDRDPGVVAEVFEQLELQRTQRHLVAADPDQACGGVDLDQSEAVATVFERTVAALRPRAGGAAGERLDPAPVSLQPRRRLPPFAGHVPGRNPQAQLTLLYHPARAAVRCIRPTGAHA